MDLILIRLALESCVTSLSCCCHKNLWPDRWVYNTVLYINSVGGSSDAFPSIWYQQMFRNARINQLHNLYCPEKLFFIFPLRPFLV